MQDKGIIDRVDSQKISMDAQKPLTDEESINKAIASSIRNKLFEAKNAPPEKPQS
jgi:hypothetical protein